VGSGQAQLSGSGFLIGLGFRGAERRGSMGRRRLQIGNFGLRIVRRPARDCGLKSAKIAHDSASRHCMSAAIYAAREPKAPEPQLR
jgi:hypothetical protein